MSTPRSYRTPRESYGTPREVDDAYKDLHKTKQDSPRIAGSRTQNPRHSLRLDSERDRLASGRLPWGGDNYTDNAKRTGRSIDVPFLSPNGEHIHKKEEAV